MSSLPNEMPALNAWWKPSCHDAVAEDHRLLLTAVTVDRVDHAGDVLLGQQLVDERELHARLLRQQFAQDQAARRRVMDLRNRLACVVDRVEAALDLGVQRRRRRLPVRAGLSDCEPNSMPSPGSLSRIIDR